ncbi:MAG: ribosome recycling factor [Actinomycetota bacterium]
MVVAERLAQAEEKMRKAVRVTREEFAAVRTGRASPKLVERINVEYYGSKVPLEQIAGISVPEARMLVIHPYDHNALPQIERAILASDLGINPSNDGQLIRLAFPPLTEQRRKELIKVVRERAEDGRVAVRNVRRHTKEDVERAQKHGDISEDDLHRLEKELQKLTDRFTVEIDHLLGDKEKELLEV